LEVEFEEKKYLFIQCDLQNNFYFRQFFIKCSFVYTIIYIAKLNPKSAEPLNPTAHDAAEPKQH
jgi:hypothetical protein